MRDLAILALGALGLLAVPALVWAWLFLVAS